MSDNENVVDPTENFEVVTNEGAAPDVEIAENQDTDDKQDPVQEPKAEDDSASATPDADDKERGSGRLQKRIDRLTKRAAEAERLATEERTKREALEQKLSGGKQQDATDEPDAADFDSYSDYLDALAKYNSDNEGKQDDKAKEADKADTKSEQKEQTDDEFAEALEDVQASFADSKAKWADFDEVVTAPDLAITNDMVKALAETDDPAAVAYYLGKNKEEAKRIAGLKPLGIARELGRIETKLAAAPIKRASSAPDPITPVSGSDGIEPELSDMSFSEYEQAMNKKQARTSFW
ncbi:hypothetical protein [Arsukibacterium sp.]|uniref:hypothetical protein n=1 Tax=Arsukibacterium sp. TaxID=1977258 RepID=UPI002FDA1102